jgi:cytochrome P450
VKAKQQPELPPSVPPDWIGGHFRQFRRNPTGFLTTLAALGDVSYFRMASQPGYFINHPDLVRDVLVINAAKFHKGRALKRAKALLGNGLLTSEGEEHLRRRKMIQPAFHKERIASYAESIVHAADHAAEKWRSGDVLDIDAEMMRLTLRIVSKTLFSADVDDDADEIGHAMTTIVELFNFLLLPFSDWLRKLPIPHSNRFRIAKATLDRVIYRLISERRSDDGREHNDLLSMLLAARDEQTGEPMTDEEIRDEALTLFLAGHETTANAMTWTWYLLSRHAEIEARLHEELAGVLGTRSPEFRDIPNLRYAEAVLAESMRLYPPAWAIGRLAIDEHVIGGFKVPRGALVLISPYVTQRDSRFWADPDAFMPERWQQRSLTDAGRQYIYFPFGGGARRCIGESFAWTEGILLIAAIARRWRFRLASEPQPKLQPLITLRPGGGMKMIAEPR